MTPLDRPLVVRSTADLVTLVPYLLGFHPAESLVVAGTTRHDVMAAIRFDLPPPPREEVTPRVVALGIRLVSVLGYGPSDAVEPAVAGFVGALRAAGIEIFDAVRVTDDRWWSYLCTNPFCCPPEGTPCRPVATAEIAAGAVFKGMVALPNRRELAARVAPVGGASRVAMRAATERAVSRMTDLAGQDLRADRSGVLVRKAGRAAVREAEKLSRAGRALSDDAVAWLGVLLADPVVQDYALDRSHDEQWRIDLWADVVRRVDPAHVAVPACLLGYAAWRAGQGALARVAVDRALREAPGHRTAALLDDLLGAAIAPHMVDLETGGERHRRRGTRRRSS